MSVQRCALIIGGIRSGKSAFGHGLALRAELEGGNRVVYVATGLAVDDEMKRRIDAHRVSRPDSWSTVEVCTPGHQGTLQQLIEGAADEEILLIDSISEWLSNRIVSYWESMDRDEVDKAVSREIHELAQALSRTQGLCVLIAQEVGEALVPENPMGRAFCDLNGLLNQCVAAVAENVWMVRAGIPQKLK